MTDRVSLDGIDQVLAGLPDSHLVGSAATARLVLGPTGAFVLLPEGSDHLTGALAVNHLAATTREAFAEHLYWVPFVDALVVTAGDRSQEPSATVVSIDLLATLLVEGPVVIDQDTSDTVTALLDSGKLAGWVPGLPAHDGSIDLCEKPVDLNH